MGDNVVTTSASAEWRCACAKQGPASLWSPSDRGMSGVWRVVGAAVFAALASGGHARSDRSASDLVQSALLKAIEALPQFRGQTDLEFAAWLRRILANKLAEKV